MEKKLFANLLNVKTTMKKYISPIAKSIELNGETALLTSSPSINDELGGEGQDSNRRHVSIWDNDEE